MAAPNVANAVDITTYFVGFSPAVKYATMTVDRMPALRCAKNTGMLAYL